MKIANCLYCLSAIDSTILLLKHFDLFDYVFQMVINVNFDDLCSGGGSMKVIKITKKQSHEIFYCRESADYQWEQIVHMGLLLMTPRPRHLYLKLLSITPRSIHFENDLINSQLDIRQRKREASMDSILLCEPFYHECDSRTNQPIEISNSLLGTNHICLVN